MDGGRDGLTDGGREGAAPPTTPPTPPPTAPPTERGEVGAGPAVTSWPVLIGVGAAVAGLVGVLVCAAALALRVGDPMGGFSGDGVGYAIARVVHLGMAVVVGCVGVVGGVRLARRRRSGEPMVLWWAWLHLGVIVAGVAFWAGDTEGTRRTWWVALRLAPLALLLLAWEVVWPLVVLVWLRRRVIRGEIRGWRRVC